jgi:CDP-glycerol glycerophosphotransferase (TagB/SpsB family)
MAELMLELAQAYKDRIQIAFKPHPSLITQLYQHPDWGKERADDYYARWQQMENTQLETGGYVDLFMTSDAMIHDSGSFVVEYLYANRPVMFVSINLQSIIFLKLLNRFFSKNTKDTIGIQFQSLLNLSYNF